MRNHIKFIPFITISALICGARKVLAQSPTLKDATGKLNTVAGKAGVSGQADIGVVVANIIKWGLSAVGLIFFVMVFYGGFMWMIARGNEQKVEKSRGVVTSAAIGLVIVLSAYAITAFVGNIFKQ